MRNRIKKQNIWSAQTFGGDSTQRISENGNKEGRDYWVCWHSRAGRLAWRRPCYITST